MDPVRLNEAARTWAHAHRAESRGELGGARMLRRAVTVGLWMVALRQAAAGAKRAERRGRA